MPTSRSSFTSSAAIAEASPHSPDHAGAHTMEGSCHVLVADDEPHIGRIIKMKLEQGPFRVTLAYDGREALEVLEREGDVCLAVLDVMMPHLSGLDVLAAIRGDDRWRELPCIILTAA